MPVPNPTMPVKGAGTTCGFIRGAVTLMRIRFQTLTGRVWQKLKT
ncbi:hypothetical protein BANRA_00664 [Escherichia coli]|nr:hypothetical protein BANRA_00664 [Escherichia coli]